ncbi:unnamed protein product [Clavelina lepadiformis]|uniref:Cadherin domain-containing protein n=1 Tax=Clavelina lepadiformis TaxID=159417 RepID=A0ABP0F839_CLALP
MGSLHGLFAISVFMASTTMTVEALSPMARTVHLKENSAPGTIVANVRREFSISSTSSKFQELEQKLLASSPTASTHRGQRKWMVLDKTIGIVTLRRHIDREAMCKSEDTCTVQLKIYVADLRQILYLNVIIDDVNDKPPVFAQRKIFLNVSENFPVNTVISLDQYLAEDADIGENGDITYSLSPNDYFQLLQFVDATNIFHLQLKLLQTLDYETESSLPPLTLTARDGGSPRKLSSYLQIQVHVIDVNDNDPKFSKLEYTETLQENLLPNKVIAQVHASDKDSGPAGEVKYFISSRNTALVRHLVSINHETGEVILIERLDREKHDGLQILIEARDSSLANQRIARTKLVIHVQDENDNSPLISINYLDTDYSTNDENNVYLREDLPLETFFALISARDADIGDNGRVKLTVSSSLRDDSIARGLDSEFRFDEDGSIINSPQDSEPVSRFLGVRRRLDREIQDEYRVIVEACDHGSIPRCSSKTITMKIMDVNDNPPVIHCPRIALSFSEDKKIGSILTTVNATDGDSVNKPSFRITEEKEIVPSPFGNIKYELLTGDPEFMVDPKTGNIHLVSTLDYETKKTHQLTVIATDGGQPMARESKCTLRFRVIDVNDNAPMFINPDEENLSFYATVLRDDIITQIKAIDYDEDGSKAVEYKILNENDLASSSSREGSLFFLSRHSGDLRLNFSNPKLKKSLGTYKLVVQAKDKGMVPMTSTRTLYVIITDLEVLPTPIPTNIKVTRGSASTFIIVAVLVSSMVILFIIIVAVVMKKRRDKKQSGSYTCRKRSIDSNEWGEASVVSMRSAEPRRALSKEGSVGNGSDLWSQSSKKKADLIVYDTSLNASNISCHDATRTSQFRSSVKSVGQQSTARSNYSDEVKRNLLEKDFAPRLTSSHDGDSGRGDSDPDAGSNNDVTYENDIFKRRPSSRLRSREGSSSGLHSRCTSQCLTYGHSDACWMPSPDQETTAPYSPVHSGNSSHIPLYVELRPASPRAYYPEQCDHPNLEPIPETRPIRHYWAYPANDLSSIYSNVVANSMRMTEPYQQVRPLGNQAPASYPRTFMAQQPHSPTRLSPISSLSSPCTSPTYSGNADPVRNHYIKRRDVAPDEVASRSATCLASPTCPLSPTGLGRSASADHILNSNHQPIASPQLHSPVEKISKSDMYGKVSMRETEEIVQNIEKLLNS